MSDPLKEAGKRRALLDTTIQLDRLKTAARKRHLDDVLAAYDWKIGTSISLLEFKATILQECITIHNHLRRTRRFTVSREELLESTHPQISLRMHIFNNVIQVFGSSFRVTEEQDQRLAEKARLLLENHIPRLYQAFAKAVDTVLTDRIDCTRAAEAPTKKGAAYQANLPICHRGVNKRCHVEKAIQDHAPSLLPRLRELAESSEQMKQLQRTCSVLDSVLQDPAADLTHRDCRGAGDFLIGLEAQGSATHALSTNAREWEPLSKLLGFEFVKIDYSK